MAGARTTEIGGSDALGVGGERTASIGKDDRLTVGGERMVSIGKDDRLTVGKKLLIEAGEELTHQVRQRQHHAAEGRHGRDPGQGLRGRGRQRRYA